MSSDTTSQDSDSLRASVYDVFLELGVLDANSRVADWFFADPEEELPDRDSEPSAVRFEDDGAAKEPVPAKEGVPRGRKTSRPTSFSRRFFSANGKGSLFKRSHSAGYESDDGYLQTPTKQRSKPPMPRSVSEAAKNLFRKRAKSPPSSDDSDFQDWLELAASSSRIFNPSADNGAPIVAPLPPPSFAEFASAFTEPADEDADRDLHTVALPHTFPLPRVLFRPTNSSKQRVAPPDAESTPSTLRRSRRTQYRRPQSMALASSPRAASSLPSSPFVLVPGGLDPQTAATATTPALVSTLDHPATPRSIRRFSDVTATRPALNPLSSHGAVSSGARLRPSSSLGSLRAASAPPPASDYDYEHDLRRGREPAFPAHPVLPQPLSPTMGSSAEARNAVIQRYRGFSDGLVERMPYRTFVQQTEIENDDTLDA
ncbi:unnamed protein product [Mycena citricolor]|uniref:Uncharacterized protein n=1 Tax=Mycena citricolor TaxID=2018698 RepID=A0AAD2HLU7_9AGAR|nr:unnamed protein product [Mycena citricolor]